LKELFAQLQEYEELDVQKDMRFELNDLKFETEAGGLKRDIYGNALLRDKYSSATDAEGNPLLKGKSDSEKSSEFNV
jgi:hypothetical protein